MNGWIVAVLILFSINSVQALWNEQHEEGWHWYQDPLKESTLTKKPLVPVDPLTEIAEARETLDRLRAEAILRPTEMAVHAYIKKQLWASNQADRFSQVWDAVIRKHPELDYALKYPTAQFARHIYLDEQKTLITQAIQQFKEQYGFLFFFKSTCPYCKAMASIVFEVSQTHGITVTAISLDGGGLKEYPNPLKDNGIVARMGVLSVPALFAVHPLKEEWFAIATGPMSATDLEERILVIAEYAEDESEESKVMASMP